MTTSPSTDPLRLGVLGASRIAPGALLTPARDTGQRLVAVAARDRSRAQAVADEFGVENVLDDYHAVIAHPDVEVVYNPLPNGLHGPWNLAAVRAGKHVLSEKPFASTAQEAEQVVAEAEKAGVVVAEAFHYRYHPVTLRTLDLLRSGAIGTLERVEVDMVMPPPADGDPRWSWELAGGGLMDVGCYAVHLLRTLGPLLGGAPRVLAARATERPEGSGVDADLVADLEFGDGTPAVLHSSMVAADRRFAFVLHGSRGTVQAPSFVLPHLDDRLVVTDAAGTPATEHLGTRSSYHYEVEALQAALRGGPAFLTGAADAVEQARLIDAVYAAAGLPPRAVTPPSVAER